MKKLCFLLLTFIVTNSYSQTILIPYRSGKLWGLADTSGKIKVTPLYDTIQATSYFNQHNKMSQEANRFFIVKKGNKYGLLKNTAVLMAPRYYRLFVDSMFIIEDNYDPKDPTIGGSKRVVYNLRGQVLIADSIMEIREILNKSDHNLLFCVWGRKNNSGVFWYDPKQQKILQWVIKGANTVFTGEYVNNVLPATIFATKGDGRQNVDIVFNPASKQYEYHPTPKQPEAGNQGRALTNREPSYHSTTNNFHLRKIEFKTSGNNVIEMRTDQRYHDRKGKTDTIHFKLSADSVQLNKYMFGNSVEWHSTIPYNNSILLDKIDSGFQYVNYITYRKNGKVGLVAEDVVIPALYQDVIYFRSGMIDKPFFMVSQASKTDGKVRWGVINSNNKVILPCIYDQIIRGGGGGFWVLKKDNLYGVADYEGKLAFQAIYEKVIPDEHFLSCAIFDKGKYGYISSIGISIKPTFPYKVNRWDTFENYNVFELIDKNDKVLGYADRKGFLYFNN